MTGRILMLLVAVVDVLPVAGQTPSPPKDSLPPHYSLLFEQGPIRILKFLGGPGDKAPMHTHPPHYAYVIRGGLVRFTYPNGQAIDAPLKTGQSLNISRPLTHAIEIAGADSVSVLVVEYRFGDIPPPSPTPVRP